MNAGQHENSRPVSQLLLLAAGVAVSGIGVSALLGWVLNIPVLTSWKSDIVPMAPLTAVLSILFGVCVILSDTAAASLSRRRLAIVLNGLVAVIAVIACGLRFSGRYLPIEHLGFVFTGTVKSAPIGYIAPATALGFLAASGTLLVTLLTVGEATWRRWLLTGAGTFIGCVGVTYCATNVLGATLLYGGGAIPPTISTSVVFVLIGLALLAFSGRQEAARGTYAVDERGSSVFSAIFTGVAVVIMVGAYGYYRQEEAQVRQQTERELAATADLKVKSLLSWRAERRQDADTLFNNGALYSQVERFLQHPTDPLSRNELRAWLAKFTTFTEYDRVFLLDAQGVARMSLPDASAAPAALLSQQAAEAIGAGRDRLVDFYIDETDGRAHLATIVPIVDKTRAVPPLGTIALRINPVPTLQTLLGNWPGSSETAETLLVRREGSDALYLSSLKFDPNAAMKLRIPVTSTNQAAVKAVLGQTGAADAIDYRGVPVLSVLRGVGDSPWFLVARIDLAELQSELKDEFFLVIGVASLLLFAVGSGLGVVWRHQRADFYKRQAQLSAALAESEERLRMALSSASQGLWDLDLTTGESIVSPEYAILLGFDPATFRETRTAWEDRIHPDDRDGVLARLADCLAGSQVEYRAQFRSRTPQGTFRWLLGIGTVVSRDERGQPLRMVGTITDIAVIKEAEAALRDSEQRLLLAMASASQGLFDLDIRTGEATTSPEYATMLGFDPAGFRETHQSWAARLHPEDREAALSSFENCLSGRADEHRAEFRLPTKSGEWKWVLSVGKIVSRAADGRPLRMLGIHADINARKVAELQARRMAGLYAALSQCNEAIVRCKSEGELFPRICEAAVAHGGMAMASVGLVDETTGLVMPVARRGIGTKYLDGRRISVDANDPFGRGLTGTAIREHRPVWCMNYAEDPATAPWRERAAEFGWVAAAALPLTRGGRPIGALSLYAYSADVFDEAGRALLIEMASDISFAMDSFDREKRRIAIEGDLLDSEARYRTLFDENNVTMLLVDPGTGQISNANQAAAHFYGWPLAVLTRMNIADLSARSQSEFAAEVNQVSSGERRYFTFRHRLANGEEREVEVFSTIVTLDGKKRLLSSVIDVTLQKQAEAALREKEYLLSESQRIAHVGSFTDDGKGPSKWSEETFRLFGVPVGSSVPPFEQLLERIHPEDRAAFQRENAANWQGESRDLEFRVMHADGTLHHLVGRGELSHDALGQPYVVGTVQDITVRKRAELAIQTSEQHYRSLFDNMLNGYAYCRMLYVDGRAEDFIYLEVNQAFETLTGLENVEGKRVSTVIPGIRETSAELFELYERVASTGVAERGELYVAAMDMWFAVSVYSPAREHFVAVFDVITERKRADRAIRASLAEKEALLKEVHHRVKNNLQVVTSLLRLEAGRSDDVLVQRTLREMQNRVMSMALIHETLYRSGDFARIDLAAYLTELAHHVFGAVTHGSNVALELDVQPASVELEQAVPCGLLVNELLSNALKHGFPDNRRGTIRLELRLMDGGPRIRLVVSDDGVGLPADFAERRARSLGLQLAADLARQLRGTLDIGGGPGTDFSLTFTPKTPADSAARNRQYGA